MPDGRTGDHLSRAGASAWARYRRLADEYRQQRILLRLVLAGSAAVVALGLAGRQAALGAAVLTALAHALHCRYRPGPGSATDWRRGALAERRTGRRLARLGRGHRVLHDRALPELPGTNLDHLVIGRTGVHAVIDRHWRPGTRLWADRYRIWAGRRPITALSATVAQIADTVAELLSAELGEEIPVSPIVAVHGARLPRGGLEHRGVVFQRSSRLPRFIRECPHTFTGAEVAAITAAAERMFPSMLDVLSHRARSLS